MFPQTPTIPLQRIDHELLDSQQLNLFILRLDTVHPHISGNKWYKLKYNLEEARRQGKDTLLTFGGAYSNHIIATAAAGKEFGFKTVGVIRGEELGANDNEALQFAKSCGMELRFVSREEYRKKSTSTSLRVTPDCYVIPEGGSNELAVKGCSEIASLITIPFDYVCSAVGTGGTIAGIISSLKVGQIAIGFSVLKGGEFLNDEVKALLPAQSAIKNPQFEIKTDYHFGGYAKKNDVLLNFISDFNSRYNIPLDFVYTGKMMYGIFDLVKNNYFPKGSTIIAIHSGGVSLPSPSERGRG